MQPLGKSKGWYWKILNFRHQRKIFRKLQVSFFWAINAPVSKCNVPGLMVQKPKMSPSDFSLSLFGKIKNVSNLLDYALCNPYQICKAPKMLILAVIVIMLCICLNKKILCIKKPYSLIFHVLLWIISTLVLKAIPWGISQR